ncbi:MAG: glycolate oxidase subunit GlcD, partial [Deltaproteobacteria bacterium]|nr:glycolate oxidase subunit GlcD [Deltaproteobacteria bacterium]
DGNLHPCISCDATDAEEMARVEKASKELFEKVTELRGTLTGEHGIGMAKAPIMWMEHDELSMEIMRNIKQVFDPNNILNPGKMGL